jgi:histidine triad (HIT) family protein
MEECLFCKIVNKEIPADIVYEDEKFLSFKDINPIAPQHLLIIPKKHILSLDQSQDSDNILLGELLLTARKIARAVGVAENGYRLVLNVGRDAGQSVNHLHLHLLGGKKLSWS